MSAKSFSKLIQKRHLKVVRMLGYVLTLRAQDAWWGLVPVLAARLTVEERAALAFMALKSLEYDEACMTADAALSCGQAEVAA